MSEGCLNFFIVQLLLEGAVLLSNQKLFRFVKIFYLFHAREVLIRLLSAFDFKQSYLLKKHSIISKKKKKTLKDARLSYLDLGNY